MAKKLTANHPPETLSREQLTDILDSFGEIFISIISKVFCQNLALAIQWRKLWLLLCSILEIA